AVVFGTASGTARLTKPIGGCTMRLVKICPQPLRPHMVTACAALHTDPIKRAARATNKAMHMPCYDFMVNESLSTAAGRKTDHSALMPASLMTGVHLAISAFCFAASAAGV